MPQLVQRYLCRCLSCNRVHTYLESELEDARCIGCGDIMGVDGTYHPQHAQAVDFAIPPPPFASADEITRREVEARSRLRVATPTTRPPVKLNGHNGTVRTGAGVTVSNAIVTNDGAVVPMPNTGAVCTVCHGYKFLLLADGTNAKKTPCWLCNPTGAP